MFRDPLYRQVRRGLRELSSMFAARLAPFEKLLQHHDVRLQRIGKIGFGHFSKLRDEQLAHEKRAAVRGELA
jgi:hypothetical protein